MTRNFSRAALALFAAVCLLASFGAFAQPGNGPGHGPGAGPGNGPGAGPGNGDHRGFGRLANYLDLTAQQIADAQAIFEATHEQVVPLHEDIQTLRDELATLFEEENLDATAVGEVVIEMHGIHEQIRSLREAAWEAFKALLTPEQLEKLEQLEAMRDEMGMKGEGLGIGPGPGAGPGGGPGFGGGF